MQHSFAPRLCKVLRLLVCAFFLALLICNARSQGQGAPGKAAPKAMDIITSLGHDVTSVLAKFGPPSDVVPARGETQDMDRVLCDYDTFMFGVRDQKIVNCFFRTDWKDPVMGIKMGDSREAVAKVLGVAPKTYTEKGVVTAYGYPMKDLGITFYTNFDAASGKVIRVEIEPLE